MATYYKPVLKLQSKNYDALYSFAKDIKEAMAGNPLFPSPPISAVSQQATIDAFGALILAWGKRSNHGSSLTRSNLLKAREQIRQMLRALASYVNTIYMGDRSVVVAAGFLHTAEKTVHGVLEAPQNVRYMYSKHTRTGSVRLRWARIRGAKGYNVYGCLQTANANPDTVDPPQFFFQVTVSKTLAVLNTFRNEAAVETPLVSGTGIMYFVRAIGLSGDDRKAEGVRSDLVSTRVA